MIPLFFDFSDARVLVVGGGPVGARKARRFAREATVVVVSPDFADADFGDASLVRAAPGPDAVHDWVARVDPAVVVAATDDEAVNDAAAAAAREAGALVNRADVRGSRPADSVVVPATVRDGPVTVAVSTDGRSPALSKHLREELETRLDGAGEMAHLSASARTALREAGADPGARRTAVRNLVRDPAVWKGLRTANPKRGQEPDSGDGAGG